jgi:uncharacterized protein YacL
VPYSFIIPIVAIAVLVVCYIALRLMRLNFQKLLLTTIGFVFGALAGVLISIPISNLPDPYKTILPITITLMAAIAMAEVFYQQHKFVSNLFPRLAGDAASTKKASTPAKTKRGTRSFPGTKPVAAISAIRPSIIAEVSTKI